MNSFSGIRYGMPLVRHPGDVQQHSGRAAARAGFKAALFAVVLAVTLPGAPQAALAGQHSEAVERIADLLEQIRARYVERIDDAKLIANAVNGVLKELDPYSKYMDPESFEKLQSHNRGEYGGVGIEVRTEKEGARVIAAFDDAPAQRAGLKPGDLIVQIDDTRLEGMELEQITQLMRGKPDTDVRLTLMREESSEPTLVTVRRSVIRWQSVRARMLESDYAYVRITNFQEHTGEMLAGLLEQLWKSRDGNIDGIVLDLRDNPGGLITAAVGVSSVFLPSDAPVVFADGAGPSSKMRLYARKQDYLRASQSDYLATLPPALKTVPLVVLVNKNSASSSEIVAGALQDHKRATVVGTLTYGKGSIQRMFPQNDGSGLKITTSHYYLPGGRKVHGTGVLPDVVVEKEPSIALAAAPEDGAKPVQPVAVSGDVAAADSKRPLQGVCMDLMHAKADANAKPAADRDCQLEEAVRVLRAQSGVVGRS